MRLGEGALAGAVGTPNCEAGLGTLGKRGAWSALQAASSKVKFALVAGWRRIQAQRGRDRKTATRIFIKIQASNGDRPELIVQIGDSLQVDLSDQMLGRAEISNWMVVLLT